jgi:hypothetical protein
MNDVSNMNVVPMLLKDFLFAELEKYLAEENEEHTTKFNIMDW